MPHEVLTYASTTSNGGMSKCISAFGRWFPARTDCQCDGKRSKLVILNEMKNLFLRLSNYMHKTALDVILDRSEESRSFANRYRMLRSSSMTSSAPGSGLARI